VGERERDRMGRGIGGEKRVRGPVSEREKERGKKKESENSEKSRERERVTTARRRGLL